MFTQHLLEQTKPKPNCITTVISLVVGINAMMGISNCAIAGIIPEDTTLVNKSGSIFFIEGGTQVGHNLFHSFSEFSLPWKHTAYFNNQANIQNIFSRITGKQASYIDGLLQANHQANLFIINPNGIIFGPNASLQIGGSFVASTANSINFTNNQKFNVKPEDSTPLLTINTPIGLQFGANPGHIQVQGASVLQVTADQTLALIGGDVLLENTNIQTIQAGGRIELGSVASEGQVSFNSGKFGFSFNFDAVSQLGNIQLSPGTNIDTLGDIQITGKNLLIDNGLVKAGNDLIINTTNSIQIFNRTGILSAIAPIDIGNTTINTKNLLVQDGSYIGVEIGNLTINASETIQVIADPNVLSDNASRIFATASEDTTKAAGNLTINTRHLSVRDGSQIITNSSSISVPSSPALLSLFNAVETVNRGNLTVNASESVTLSGSSFPETYPSGLFTTTFEGEDSGKLTINTKFLSITDGAQIFTMNYSENQSGNLLVNATEKVEITGTSPTGKIATDAQNNGLIDEPVPDIMLKGFPFVPGLQIENTLPSGLFSNAPGLGDAGDIHIHTRELVARDGGQISANTFDEGRGGNLKVNATQQVQLLGASANGISSGLFTRANPLATGEAGTLNILTGNLLVQDGAQVSASTFGVGKGGNLNVQATEGIKLIGVSRQNVPSGLFTQANPIRINDIDIPKVDESITRGDAGEINIHTSSLLVRDGAQVSASTFGSGKGGNVIVKATGGIELIGTSGNEDLFPSGLFAAAINATGDAGNLVVNSPSLLVRDGAQVGVSTSGAGKGGNLTLNIPDRMQLIGTAVNGAFPSGLFATAAANSTGNAGNLIINTNLLQVWQKAGIAVQSRGEGGAGNLHINAGSIDLNNQAFISADTRGVNAKSNLPQANINLRSQDLILLRGNSSITTNARGSNVVGGNITIDTQLLAAFENSDISANSADFRGGSVKITAEGITGTQFRTGLTPESDITATGATPELSGTVEITTPEVDPSRGLMELPSNVSDVSNRIAQKCRTNAAVARQANEFLITGKGGIPANPYDTLESESAIASWINVNHINNVAKNQVNYPKVSSYSPHTIVEAKALTLDAHGNLILTAETPNSTSQNPALIHPICAS
ncbi:S-layer family protein [Anabaena sp. 4-3]|uniref:two-partner secretion domain-containing protein n=1 Tax=Anabaena sp. 4-3 TaxID=1811979 RepID=UPI000834231C|nr:S-layer family protein [Anabaena sp. 4-3]